MFKKCSWKKWEETIPVGCLEDGTGITTISIAKKCLENYKLIRDSKLFTPVIDKDEDIYFDGYLVKFKNCDHYLDIMDFQPYALVTEVYDGFDGFGSSYDQDELEPCSISEVMDDPKLSVKARDWIVFHLDLLR